MCFPQKRNAKVSLFPYGYTPDADNNTHVIVVFVNNGKMVPNMSFKKESPVNTRPLKQQIINRFYDAGGLLES